MSFVKRSGPTAVEYAVMLALIIVVCITAVTTLGANANNTFSYVGEVARPAVEISAIGEAGTYPPGPPASWNVWPAPTDVLGHTMGEFMAMLGSRAITVR